MSDKNITNRIIAYIAQNIQNGTWIPGEKIASENELCRTLGVGRMSVRNALQHFIALGILSSKQGKGTFLLHDDVSAFTSEPSAGSATEKDPETLADMKHLLEFRALIEPQICEAVAPIADGEFLDRLEELLVAMQNAINDSNAFVYADIKFHMTICEKYGNPMVVSIMKDVAHNKRDSYLRLNHTVGSYGGIYYHSLLLDALKKHDGKRAQNIMREHLEHSIRDLDLAEEK